MAFSLLKWAVTPGTRIGSGRLAQKTAWCMQSHVADQALGSGAKLRRSQIGCLLQASDGPDGPAATLVVEAEMEMKMRLRLGYLCQRLVVDFFSLDVVLLFPRI